MRNEEEARGKGPGTGIEFREEDLRNSKARPSSVLLREAGQHEQRKRVFDPCSRVRIIDGGMRIELTPRQPVGKSSPVRLWRNW